MTAIEGAGQAAPRWPALARNVVGNLRAWIAALFESKRGCARRGNYRALLRQNARQAAILLGLVALTMVLVDPWAGVAIQALPARFVAFFAVVTDFGRSGWILVPAGLLILSIAALSSPALDRLTRGMLAALVVRLGFVFVAIGLPGLVATTLKRLIGRIRPSAEGAFAYAPLSWRPDYASLPSGHTVTAFAALVAIGLVVPRARPFLWVYAVAIGLSRIVVSAHFPSDVIAGAAFGAFGAVLVREWFASRGLGFRIDPAGVVRTLPGPSLARAFRALRAAAFAAPSSGWRKEGAAAEPSGKNKNRSA